MRWRNQIALSAAILTAVGLACAQSTPTTPPSDRQSLNDAWFTGPMLAPNATTLPHGHFLLEPYLYDVITLAQYDNHGVRRNTPRSNSFGSLTYLNYGLTDKLTVGVIPTAGYNVVSEGPDSSAPRFGDLTVQAQYRLHLFHEGSSLPTASIAVQETLPTGRYDHLGNYPSDGLGAGAYTTTVALYTQDYFWLPNGRILRFRFNVAPAFSSNVHLEDVSVFGTSAGFRGNVKPGNSILVDAAWEYSMTRNWVLALDATYRYQANSPIIGMNTLETNPPIVQINSGPSDAFGLAPAIEYNWKRNLGVLLGTRLIPLGRNTAYTVTPAIALNFFH